MAERQPYHPPITEPQRSPHEGGNDAPGLQPNLNLNERAKLPPEDAVNKPRLTPEERREKKLQNSRDYKKTNKDKVNAYQRRRYHYGPTRPNEKLREYQYQRALERIAKFREQQANEASTDTEQDKQQQSDAVQIFPRPPRE